MTQLQPMTFEEALALVIMLDVPTRPFPYMRTGQRHSIPPEAAALARLVETLPIAQYKVMQRTIDEFWPTYSYGLHSYQKVWATALHHASQVQEAAMRAERLNKYFADIAGKTMRELIDETRGLEALLCISGSDSVQLARGTRARLAWDRYTNRIFVPGEVCRQPNRREQWENRLAHARMVAFVRASPKPGEG